ncbi:hypothetical protein QR680_003034 [Steinernema hermaphroditum]|uniref:Homeobox domain-containing protein n=1 Tax=Steinernema hermaphroditum TaxID=289476 RepID=A0AA39H543_9BILA|nr:hypothetical protein QR680_003034 [Steinernema hermaphroditum]
MFTYNSTSEYESTANQKQMARELRGTIPHLQSDVAKLKQEIDAKERLLKEVLRDLGGIPPDERDRKLIDAVLHVTPGKFSDTAQADKRITLNQKWTLCFENMICVAAEINNNSDDSCDINSEVFTTNGSVTSYQTIFDGTSTISSIPGNCSRLVVIAFNKSAILHGNTSIVFDCYFSSPPSGSSDNFFLNELRPVTGNVIDRFQRLMLPTLPMSHLPEYCQVMRVKGTNGEIKELVFPKALDLDRPKRPRTTFTPEQLRRLEAEFEKNPYLVGDERSKLANTLSLTDTQVKVCESTSTSPFQQPVVPVATSLPQTWTEYAPPFPYFHPFQTANYDLLQPPQSGYPSLPHHC